MNNFEKIKQVLGEPERTFNDTFNRQWSHWWLDRAQEDFNKVKYLGAEKVYASNVIIQGSRFDINYVEYK